MGDPGKEASMKELPASIYVCPAETSDKKTVCAAVAIGRILQLTVYDYRTRKPVAGATLRRQTISGQDKVKLEYAIPSISELKDYHSAKEADKCRAAIGEYNALLEEEQKAKAEQKALSKPKQYQLRIHAKNLGRYNKVIAERESWVAFMQTGFKILKAYEGEINDRMDEDLGKVIGKYWNYWTEGKNGKFVPERHWKTAAEQLLLQLQKKYATDNNGKVFIPLPEKYVGKIEIEFACFKLLDPTDASKAINGSPESDDWKTLPADPYVDYDLATAASEMHANDAVGSTKRESRWRYRNGTQCYSFKNYIEVDIKAPSENEKTKPIACWTVALLWGQPVWTEIERNYIYDPVDPHHPSDPLPHEDRFPQRRGLLGRGRISDGRPTLLACTIGFNTRSKHYGVYGNKGRMQGGNPKLHHGIDCAGFVGNPVFSPVGGKISDAHLNYGAAGNVILIKPWISRGPRLVQLLHLKDGGIQVKKGQVVKAGDFLAEMGRTGNFSPPTPSPYPTHTHFMWQSIDLYHPPSGLEDHAGIMPHNGLPRVLPCGGDYPDYASDAMENPKNCKFDYDGFVGGKGKWYCFAVEELACPFMPETITIADLQDAGPRKAKRRFQAQLKWLYDQDHKKYLDPGRIDGDLGKVPHARMTGADKHRTIRRWLDEDPPPKEWPLLFEADRDEIFPLVDDTKIGDRYKMKLTADHVRKYKDRAKANGQELKAGDFALVYCTKSSQECKIENLSPIRKAIKKFNDQQDPESGYEISETGLKKLNNLTGICKDKMGNSNGVRWQRPGDPLS
jgi:hypothetical protein